MKQKMEFAEKILDVPNILLTAHQKHILRQLQKKLTGEPVTTYKINDKTTACEVLDMMYGTSFQARSLGKAFKIWQNALRDETVIFFGLAGAMVPAGLRDVIVYLIKNRLIDVLVSTGANLFHDLFEILGGVHYKCSPDADDVQLRNVRLDRMYDVVADDMEYEAVDYSIVEFASKLEKRPYSTREFFYKLGCFLQKRAKNEGIITACARHGVPIYCPAIADSSYGIALSIGRNNLLFDVVKDVTETCNIAANSKVSAVIFIGGGTPKNFVQQTEITAFMSTRKGNIWGHKYCIQITTDSPQWGGLSGCTFKESQSWGKIAPDSEKVHVYCDATIALPLLVSGLAEKKAFKFRKTTPYFKQERNLKMFFKSAGRR
jgi:deoxyhypusine synthase